jgi:hypothetical protein
MCALSQLHIIIIIIHLFIYSIDPSWQTVPSDIEHVKNQTTVSTTIQNSVTYIQIKIQIQIWCSLKLRYNL